MNKEGRPATIRERHLELHGALDQLIAAWAASTHGLLSQATIQDLMIWSYHQTLVPTYEIYNHETAILCRRCGRTSHNPDDVARKYCGFCHRFHDQP